MPPLESGSRSSERFYSEVPEDKDQAREAFNKRITFLAKKGWEKQVKEEAKKEVINNPADTKEQVAEKYKLKTREIRIATETNLARAILIGGLKPEDLINSPQFQDLINKRKRDSHHGGAFYMNRVLGYVNDLVQRQQRSLEGHSDYIKIGDSTSERDEVLKAWENHFSGILKTDDDGVERSAWDYDLPSSHGFDLVRSVRKAKSERGVGVPTFGVPVVLNKLAERRRVPISREARVDSSRIDLRLVAPLDPTESKEYVRDRLKAWASKKSLGELAIAQGKREGLTPGGSGEILSAAINNLADGLVLAGIKPEDLKGNEDFQKILRKSGSEGNINPILERLKQLVKDPDPAHRIAVRPGGREFLAAWEKYFRSIPSLERPDGTIPDSWEDDGANLLVSPDLRAGEIKRGSRVPGRVRGSARFVRHMGKEWVKSMLPTEDKHKGWYILGFVAGTAESLLLVNFVPVAAPWIRAGLNIALTQGINQAVEWNYRRKRSAAESEVRSEKGGLEYRLKGATALLLMEDPMEYTKVSLDMADNQDLGPKTEPLVRVVNYIRSQKDRGVISIRDEAISSGADEGHLTEIDKLCADLSKTDDELQNELAEIKRASEGLDPTTNREIARVLDMYAEIRRENALHRGEIDPFLADPEVKDFYTVLNNLYESGVLDNPDEKAREEGIEREIDKLIGSKLADREKEISDKFKSIDRKKRGFTAGLAASGLAFSLSSAGVQGVMELMNSSPGVESGARGVFNTAQEVTRSDPPPAESSLVPPSPSPVPSPEVPAPPSPIPSPEASPSPVTAAPAGGEIAAGAPVPAAEPAWDGAKAALSAPTVNVESHLSGEQLRIFESLRDSHKIGEISMRAMGGYGDYLSPNIDETTMGGVGKGLVQKIIENNPNLANVPQEQMETIVKKLIEDQANLAMEQAVKSADAGVNSQTVSKALDILESHLKDPAFQNTVATHAQEKFAQVIKLSATNPEAFQAADIAHLAGVSDAEVYQAVSEVIKQYPSAGLPAEINLPVDTSVSSAPFKQAVFEAVASQAKPLLAQQAATIATLPPDQALAKLAEMGKHIPTEQIVANLSKQFEAVFNVVANLSPDQLAKLDEIINGAPTPEAAAQAIQKDPEWLSILKDVGGIGKDLAPYGAMSALAATIFITAVSLRRRQLRGSAPATTPPVAPPPIAAFPPAGPSRTITGSPGGGSTGGGSTSGTP